VEYTGKISLETIDTEGNIIPSEQTVMVNENLPCILLSPQAFLQESAKSIDDHFSIYADRTEWHVDGSHRVDIPYDSSFLPRLTLFTPGHAEPALKAFFTLFHSSNRNLSPWAKISLKWHHKLGHASFSLISSLGARGYLDKQALALADSSPSDTPKCEACRYGRQVKRPDGTTTTRKNPDRIGALKLDQLKPGQTIFCDQLESRVRGRLLHTAGREPTSSRFCGTTVFCDAASNYIHVEHQVTLNASDTINSKLCFERTEKEMGVTVDAYHTEKPRYFGPNFSPRLRLAGLYSNLS
jgi:hypothetical protein